MIVNYRIKWLLTLFSVNAPVPRRLRADAARNAERIVRAARQAFAELGSAVSLEEIARRSEVGVATLYRRFANKEELIRAILETRFDEDVQPAIERAETDADPWHAMVSVLEAILTVATEEKSIVQAARDLSAVTGELFTRFFTDLAKIVRRAQRAGLVRSDLEYSDLPRLVTMLMSTTRLSAQPNQDWRRYLALLLDALRPGATTVTLPPASPLRAPFTVAGGATERGEMC